MSVYLHISRSLSISQAPNTHKQCAWLQRSIMYCGYVFLIILVFTIQKKTVMLDAVWIDLLFCFCVCVHIIVFALQCFFVSSFASKKMSEISINIAYWRVKRRFSLWIYNTTSHFVHASATPNVLISNKVETNGLVLKDISNKHFSLCQLEIKNLLWSFIVERRTPSKPNMYNIVDRTPELFATIHIYFQHFCFISFCAQWAGQGSKLYLHLWTDLVTHDYPFRIFLFSFNLMSSATPPQAICWTLPFAR